MTKVSERTLIVAKSKKRRQEELIQGILGLIVLICAVLYFQTGSLAIAIIVGIVLLSIYIGFIVLTKLLFQEKMRRSGILEIDKMTGNQFEKYLGELFKFQGYKTKVTPASGDYGADLVIERNRKRIVVQAKRYKNNVGIKAVQEIYSSRKHYNASEAWVVTNSNYTTAAKKLASSNDVRLIGREHLIKWSTDFQDNKKKDIS
jgi:restriction system protein